MQLDLLFAELIFGQIAFRRIYFRPNLTGSSLNVPEVTYIRSAHNDLIHEDVR